MCSTVKEYQSGDKSFVTVFIIYTWCHLTVAITGNKMAG